MANYQQLKAAIDQVIKANGQKEITGPILNDTLKAIVNSLGAGYQFMGVATPSTNPGTPDQNVFYLAGQAGLYVNFGAISLQTGINVLKWKGSWHIENLDDSFVEDIYERVSQETQEVTDQIQQEVTDFMESFEPIVVEGNVTNAPDEEDLTSVNQGGTDVLKFKNKSYSPLTYSGMGRVYLRKNIVGGSNLLTQDMFYKTENGERVPATNSIFIIQYDFELAENITIPENCVLQFEGGSMRNGNLIFNKTIIYSFKKQIFDNVYFLSGTLLNKELYASWFGVVGDNVTDDTDALNYFFNVNIKADFEGCYILDSLQYLTSDTIELGIDPEPYQYYVDIPVRSVASCTIIGSIRDNIDSFTTINCTNNSVPIFLVHTHGTCFKNLSLNCTSVSVDENSVGIRHKMISNEDTTNPIGGDADCRLQYVSVSNCYKAFELWGHQFRCWRCGTNCSVFFELNSYENVPLTNELGNSRSIEIINCGGHGMPVSSVFLKLNSEQTWGLSVKDNYTDTHCDFIHGSIHDADIIGNVVTSMSETNVAIKSPYIKKCNIANNRFTSYYENEDHVICSFIMSELIEDTNICGNRISRCAYESIYAKRAERVSITNNIFGAIPYEAKIVDYNLEEIVINSDAIGKKVLCFILIGDKTNRNNEFITISNNIFGRTMPSYPKNSVILAYIGSNATGVGTDVFTAVGNSMKNYEVGYPSMEMTISVLIDDRLDASIIGPNVPYKGSTSERAALSPIPSGFQYFDTTLGKPTYWNGTAWVDATGATV